MAAGGARPHYVTLESVTQKYYTVRHHVARVVRDRPARVSTQPLCEVNKQQVLLKYIEFYLYYMHEGILFQLLAIASY